ncbi:glycoside hydrolase, partial [Dimargaris cristalligena]
QQRASEIKGAIRHAWRGYAAVAFGHDEIAPVSNLPIDSYGVTLIDALDTLWIAGLEDEFQHALQRIYNLSYDYKTTNIQFFGTVIRTIGGLLSAHELSQNQQCLLKALEMAEILVPAFNTATHLPAHAINPKLNRVAYDSWVNGHTILSEMGSIQLEYKKLSHYSLDPKYDQKVSRLRISGTLNRLTVAPN